MTYDYPAPLYSDDDEEEERKNRYPAPRPVAGPPGPPPGYTPISPEEQSQRLAALPAPEPSSDVALAYQPPQPPAQPRIGHEQTVQDQADLDRMKAQGSGVSQVGHGHGFLHGLARFGDVLGSILAPGITEQIPGTELHHRMLIHQREGDVGRDLAEEKEEAGTGLTEAETDEAKLRTKNLGEPKTQNPEEQAFQGYLKQGMSPMDAYRKIKEDAQKPANENDKEKDIGDYLQANNLPDTPANREKARDAIAKRAPSAHVSVEGAGGNFMPLYDDKGHVSGAWNPKTGQIQKPPSGMSGTTSQGVGIASKAEAATDKKTAPLKAAIDEVDTARELKKAADGGNAEADVGLTLAFFKSMRGATGPGGAGGGIRFTQQEQSLIMGAKSLWGGLEVAGNKVLSNGQPLSSTQRQQIMDVIELYGKAAQRHLDDLKAPQNGAPAQPGAFDFNSLPDAPQ